MIARKLLTLDANIMIRGSLGRPVRHLLETFADMVEFHSPDICFADARRHIIDLSAKRRLDLRAGLRFLDEINEIVQVMEDTDYKTHQTAAEERIRSRDLTDWPIVATCMLLNAPLWTEDRDFFGCGIATWTTNNVEIYLRSS